ncbi:hypothetical protein RF11_12354 [Thelohanellus kitauei]|uniref:Uncharacterized protein n=1 Tax=Thelohanellus kitauei TaxID=669202 RepID=A0A0C2NFU0_THEKT|nr:hypothetical protein RF11_12354 [Thelohanellus kitauei]
MIPTIGFAVGKLFKPQELCIVFATNDDEDQRGKLFIYKFMNNKIGFTKYITLQDSSWPALSNFGSKIVIMDINNDSFNDLIVTSPTSEWRTSYLPLDITIKFTVNPIQFNDEIQSLIETNYFSGNVTICLKNGIESENVTISLSIVPSIHSSSFHNEWLLDELFLSVTPQNGGCINHSIYLHADFYNSPLKWMFQAEIVPREHENINDRDQSMLVSRKFFSEINSDNRCTKGECGDNNYTLTLNSNPIWFKNRDSVIIFHFKLENNGDLLSHLIIDATILLPCEFKKYNADKEFRYFPIHEDFVNSTKSHIRGVYRNQSELKASFEFYIFVLCPQYFSKDIGPVLELSIQSFFPFVGRRFSFPTQALFAYELFVEAEIHPTQPQHICRDTETEVTIHYIIDIMISGFRYGHSFLFEARLYFDETAISVKSIQITSTDWDAISIENTTMLEPGTAFQKFRLRKASNIEKSQLHVAAKLNIGTKHDLVVSIQIHSYVGNESTFDLSTIMVNDHIGYSYILVKLCKRDMGFLILAICLTCAICFGLSFLIYEKIYIRYFSKIVVPLYFMEPLQFPE